jgi:mutator protein MutT
MKHVDVAIGIVLRAGRILICQRRSDGPLPGFWEFPGGKVEPSETAEQALLRELREELAIDVRNLEALTPIEFAYAEAHVRLHPFICQHEAGEARPLASRLLRWVEPNDLRNFSFPPANDALIKHLIDRFGMPATEQWPRNN